MAAPAEALLRFFKLQRINLGVGWHRNCTYIQKGVFMSDLRYWVALSNIREIGPIRFFKLFDKYQDIKKVFYFTREDLSGLRISEEKISQILNFRNSLNPNNELDKIVKNNIKVISFFSEYYPEQLKEIYAPPYLFYALGNLELLTRASLLAVVGTRYPSFYGVKMAVQLTQDLVRSGWGIVSGLAKGVDAKAHETTIKLHGQTIAVLGCGLDVIYPYENRYLYQKIKEQGLILSEVPLGTKPHPILFPLRNRIITGLSKGTLVIEGDYKSGAMISGKLALDQNREVFALPGRVTDKLSNGPNWLIKQGATPVTSGEDILEEFGSKKKQSVVKSCVEHKPTVQLSFEEEKIYKELSDEDSINIEDLSDKAGLLITDLMSILSTLELKNVVKQLPGKLYLKL